MHSARNAVHFITCVSLIVSLTVASALLMPQSNRQALAQTMTEVSGQITTNTTWTLANSPYRVTGGITINQGVTLTIEPGVRVEFGPGYWLIVEGALNAIGSASLPITFTGSTEQPGWWVGIVVWNAGTATLEHVVVANAGSPACFGGFGCERFGIGKTGTGALTLRFSTIRNTHGNGTGLYISDSAGAHQITGNLFTDNGYGVTVLHLNTPLTLVNNQIAGNLSYGVFTFSSATVYARSNWWGHASGPKHPTINPGGQGDEVTDGVLFYPWKVTPDINEPPPEEALVVISGPDQVSSGQQATYRVTYQNQMTSDIITNAVLMMRLPALATFVESSDGGIYWPERHLVFWKLGNLAPAAQGEQWLRVQYLWGIPNGQTDTTTSLLVGSNYQADLLDLNAYLNYTPPVVSAAQPLTQAQWNALLAAAPRLNALFTQSLAEGYRWASADRYTVDGRAILQAMLLHPQRRSARILTGNADSAQMNTFSPRHYAVTDGDGGFDWDIATDQRRLWGAWDANHAASPGTLLDLCGAGCCLQNCLANVLLTSIGGRLSKAIEATLTTKACYDALRTQESSALANCAASLKSDLIKVQNVPVMGEVAGATECLARCAGDPASNDCAGDLVTCEPSWSNIYDWLGVPSKTIWRCRNGCYSNLPEYIPCAFGDCCIPGIGCSNGVSSSHCRQERVTAARDPNEVRGPEGDLLPGQEVTYTIEYENVGAGAAYGVFITAELSDVFDDATLRLGGTGVYYASARLISWDIGELAPRGQPGSTGTVTLTVRLRSDLRSGTPVSFQAVVSFPSVPEETPTNTWINLVAPLSALPQELTTDHRAPLTITLSGRDASGAPLTYAVVDRPRGGELTGAAPTLTYTPAENFTGLDSFTFQVSNGIATSRPATVQIDVRSTGDATPPVVLWTEPTADASGVIATATPVFTDTLGAVYGPVILIGMSEPLDAATVTSATVRLARADGTVITATPTFDSGANQIALAPRVALPNGRYVVTITTGVKDQAGNALATAHTWNFTVGAPEQKVYVPLVIQIMR